MGRYTGGEVPALLALNLWNYVKYQTRSKKPQMLPLWKSSDGDQHFSFVDTRHHWSNSVWNVLIPLAELFHTNLW